MIVDMVAPARRRRRVAEVRATDPVSAEVVRDCMETVRFEIATGQLRESQRAA